MQKHFHDVFEIRFGWKRCHGAAVEQANETVFSVSAKGIFFALMRVVEAMSGVKTIKALGEKGAMDEGLAR